MFFVVKVIFFAFSMRFCRHILQTYTWIGNDKYVEANSNLQKNWKYKTCEFIFFTCSPVRDPVVGKAVRMPRKLQFPHTHAFFYFQMCVSPRIT